MPADAVIGWDLGGAHLKAARVAPDGQVVAVAQVACPLWQGLQHLEAAIASALPVVGDATRHAITMTGEMADLFPGRRDGVIALAGAMGRLLPAADLRYFADGARFVGPGDVPRYADAIASANWLASAAVVARRLPAALFLDIGSTTTDLVPVAAGEVRTAGAGDYRRLVNGELVYTGVVRTPLMALGQAVQLGADQVPLMAEYFATTADVYRVTRELPEGADLHPAADGGAKGIAESTRRIGRMIGRDLESFTRQEWEVVAGEFRRLQVERLAGACARQLARGLLPVDAPLVGAGVGRFLVPELARRVGRPALDFAALFPRSAAEPARIADCAPAVAVALLALEVD
ncbi:MAG: tetrahydromethanopterin biosynthesis protein [Gemmatimonadetes bacterium]|nr:tetrahydromethanopterin biosynthesis protein [Gemmatimonadota bacterium]